MNKYKNVVLTINVPDSNYCCQLAGDWNTPHCSYFDNDGGHPTCAMGFSLGNRDNIGYLKDKECLTLEVI